MSVSDLFRYLLITVVGLVILVIGLKLWNKQGTEKRVVRELRELTNPTSSFEQFYAADAQKVLFRSMAQMHTAESKINKEPAELLDKVFYGKGSGALFPSEDPMDDRRQDPSAILIREGLLRNYQNCKTLGIFENSSNVRLLTDGEAPEITIGRDEGATVKVRYIIDPEVSPGVEKIIPNLVISPPPDKKDGGKPTEFQIKQAKTLTTLMYRANLLEREAQDRIVEHYDNIAKGVEEVPVEDVDPEPAPVGADSE